MTENTLEESQNSSSGESAQFEYENNDGSIEETNANRTSSDLCEENTSQSDSEIKFGSNPNSKYLESSKKQGCKNTSEHDNENALKTKTTKSMQCTMGSAVKVVKAHNITSPKVGQGTKAKNSAYNNKTLFTPVGGHAHTIEHDEDLLEIDVDPDQDDLDRDNTPPAKRRKAINKGKNNKTPKTLKTTGIIKTPKKQKLSVAGRIMQTATPISDTLHVIQQPLTFTDTEQAQRDLEVAQQMVLHSQREVELAKKRLMAQQA